MIFAWIGGLAVVGIAALASWFYAPDKPRAALEAAYPGEYRTVAGVRLAPTLLLWGEKDAMIPISNADDYRRAMPTA